ncbi:MAG: heavy metal-responsive transcriptional regulator [Rhodothermia bacterium]|nr:heavy metal-responsive transcriptional regulator [Rhodothermia bacterium]
MTIGQLAKKAGVTTQTIRFYERKGLVLPEGRTTAGYRRYSGVQLKRIGFIKQAQGIGFSLGEIKELLSLRVDPSTTCADVRQRAEKKVADVSNRVRKLRQMEHALQILIEQCDGRGPVSECPIIDTLDRIELVNQDS